MAAVAEKLSFAEFQAKYERGDRSYEYWHGEAIPKGMPTWIHGLLQRIVMELLTGAGYIAGSEVELRIIPNAHPKPDVIATSGKVENPYPTKAVDVVVEILSPDDAMSYVIEKCQAYQSWGFKHIYVVNPEGSPSLPLDCHSIGAVQRTDNNSRLGNLGTSRRRAEQEIN